MALVVLRSLHLSVRHSTKTETFARLLSFSQCVRLTRTKKRPKHVSRILTECQRQMNYISCIIYQGLIDVSTTVVFLKEKTQNLISNCLKNKTVLV